MIRSNEVSGFFPFALPAAFSLAKKGFKAVKAKIKKAKKLPVSISINAPPSVPLYAAQQPGSNKPKLEHILMLTGGAIGVGLIALAVTRRKEKAAV